MSGPVGHWSAAEDAALHELPHVAQLIYLRGLRRFVDAQTGTVGLARVVSRRSLVELLTVPGRRGRHNAHEVDPSEGMVRHALRALEGAGLIVPVAGYERRLVFRLPMALEGQSVSRMSDRMSDRISSRMNDRSFDPENPSPYAVFEGVERWMSDRISDRMSDAMSDRTSEEHSLGNAFSACRSTSRALGALCKRLRSEAGMLDANPHRPELIGLLSDGFDADAIVGTAMQLRQARGTRGPPNVGYLVATVRGRARDAREQQEGGSDAGRSGYRESVCEQIERQDREETERERRQQRAAV